MKKSTSMPTKVSIGMPVYNGADLIERAIDSLLEQSFADFELIISDNSSSDRTQELCLKYANQDPRIRYFRQESNIQALPNFDFVLNQSSGEFFMWAAHDDAWDKQFLEKMVDEFSISDDSVVAVGCEAQYTVDLIEQPFFREGVAFYGVNLECATQRVSYVLRNGYGNMFYSLYRRKCFYQDGVSILSRFSQVSLNELPFFISMAFQGNWKIVSDVYFYKETTPLTYARARWEMLGGWLPLGSLRQFFSGQFYSLKYHLLTLIDLFRSIVRLKVSILNRVKLLLISSFRIPGHYLMLLLHYKKRPVSKLGKSGDA